MPHPEPRLTVRAIRPLVSGLAALGYDPAPFLSDVGLDTLTLDDPDARVPMSAGVRLLTLAVERTGDTNLGLHLAQRAELSSVDLHFYAMASSSSLGTAYERVCRYQRLINDTSTVELTMEQERASLRHVLPGGAVAPRQSAEFILTSWVRAGRAVTGVDWAPHEVRFAHAAPAGSHEHADFFRAPVRFATGENALELDRSLLALPCVRPEPALASVLDRYAADRLERVPPESSLADHVRRLLEEDLRDGEPTAQRVAARLRMSVRTLNRQLAEEHTSFRQVLDRLRHGLAAKHLAADALAIGQVAFVLGFSELSSFHRAFRRWTGTTPAEFRRQQRSTHR